MSEQDKCKNCQREFPKISENHNLCYQCSIERTESTVNDVKKILERAREELDEALSKGADSDLIKKIKENIKKCEQMLARTENTHLESLLLFTTDLTTLESNYQKVKNHSLYAIRKSRRNFDRIYRE